MSAQSAAETTSSSSVSDCQPSSGALLRDLHGLRVNGLSDSYLFKGVTYFLDPSSINTLLPVDVVDDEEFVRLNAHSAMFAAGLGGLFPAPASECIQNALQTRNGYEKSKILDIGTGSEDWAIEMARAYPEADVVGMDLIPVKLSSPPPLNCHFEVGNADTDLETMYGTNSFDFIHARTMMQGVKDFPRFYQNIARILRPGGVFITMDGRLTTWTEDRQEFFPKNEEEPGFSWFRKMIFHMREALNTRNPNMPLMDHLTDCVRSMCGDDVWEKVEEFNLYLPVGNFDSSTMSENERRGGKFFAQSLYMLPDSIRPILLSSSLTPEEVDRVAAGVRSESRKPLIKQFSLVSELFVQAIIV